jgi:integrase
MSKSIKFTDRYLAALPLAPPGKLTEVYDTFCTGLAVRSSAHSHTFVCHGTIKGEGKSTRYSIGKVSTVSLAAARAEAIRIKELMALGMPVVTVAAAARAAERKAIEAERAAKLVAKEASANTFGRIATDYIIAEVRKNKSGDQTERNIERIWIAPWRERPITSITRADVRTVIKGLTDSGATGMACVALANIKALFNWCLAEDRVTMSPCAGIKAAKKVQRDRVLSDGAIRIIWSTAIKLSHPWGDLVRLLLLTGLRLRECADLTYGEVDMDAATITVPPQRMKGKREHRIPLAADALALIASFPRRGRRDRLFTQASGRPLLDFGHGKKIIDMAVTKAAGGALPRWTFHDLRRTARSHFSALPGSDTLHELAIAHAPTGVFGTYNRHRYEKELVALFDAWAARLNAIVGDNIVSLPVWRA